MAGSHRPAYHHEESYEMPVSVTMPRLGESVTEGTVTRWLKQVGEDVAADEPLLEVSTDKVDTEIPAPVAGTLLEIVVGEDETAEVGAKLAVIGAKGAAPAAAPTAPAATAAAAPAAAVPAEAAQLRGKTVKMSRIRKVIAENMMKALHSQAQLSTVVEVDVTKIMRLRARAKESFLAREGVKLSPMPF